MDPSKQDYAAFFRLYERPFSLTPDPRFYFRSRSHARVFDALSAAIARRESVMLVLGDLGVGKTTLCRTLLDLQERKSRAALVGNALLSPDDLLRLMLQDLGAVSKDEVTQGSLQDASRAQLLEMFDQFLGRLKATERRRRADRRRSPQPAAGDEGADDGDCRRSHRIAIACCSSCWPASRRWAARRCCRRAPTIACRVRARLLPLERDECERYIIHRLAIGGGNAVTFSTPRDRRDLRAVRRRAAARQPAVRARPAGSRRRRGQSHRARR